MYELVTVPGLRCITACCTAPGTKTPYAATRAKNPSTSPRKAAAAASTSCEAVSTSSAERRVSPAACVTSSSTETTSLAPSAAPVTLCEISDVAELCCDTEADTAVAHES